MKQNSILKKTITLLLVIVMALGMLPTVALAGEHDGQVHVIVENTTYSKEDGAPWEGTLVDTWVSIDSSSTMMSAVVSALDTVGATQVGAESNYISEINGLAAGVSDNGMNGWMGTLNDWFTNEGFGAFTVAADTLAAGDEIRIMHSMDYGEDIGGSWSNNDKTVQAIAFSAGALDNAFDKSTHAYTLTLPAGTTEIVVTPTASNKNFQVRTSIGTTEYKRTDAVPVENGSVITVKCGDPIWPTMNGGDYGEADSIPAEIYTFTVAVPASADVTVALQEGNSYLLVPETLTVAGDLAESYGYTDSFSSVQAVSALDVLVRLHEVMLKDTFTVADRETYLKVSETGTMSRIMGTDTYSFSFAINGAFPYDPESTYGSYGYTGYSINQAVVANGDEMDFFFYQDSMCMDYYTWFEQNGSKVKELTVRQGEPFSLDLHGFVYMFGSYTKEDLIEMSSWGPIEDAQLETVNASTAAKSNITGAITDENGEVTISFAEAGTYYVSAYTDYDDTYTYVTSPWLKVTVTGNTAPVRKQGISATAVVGTETGSAYELDLDTIFEDAEGDELNYKVSVDGADAVAIDASYSYTPTTVQTHTLRFSASDGLLASTDMYTVSLNTQQGYSKLASLIVHTGNSPSNTSVLLKNAADSYTSGATFSSDTLTYTLAAQSDSLNQLRFRALAAEEGATVTIKYYNEVSKDITWTSGSSKWANCITGGRNTFAITVTPPDGSSKLATTYTFTVDCVPTLTGINASVDAVGMYLDTTFAAATTNYSMNIPSNADILTVAATPTSADYAVTYNGNADSAVNISGVDKIDVMVSAGTGANTVSNIYTINLNKLTQLDFSINLSPADAIVKVYDPKGAVLPQNSDGSFTGMFSTGGYTYAVTKYGHVAQSGDVPVTGGELTVALEPAADDGISDVSAYWKNFRNSDVNMAITDALLPIDTTNINLKWNKKLGSGWTAAPSVQIIVDNSLIVMSNKTIYKLNLLTGDVIATGTMAAAPNFGYTPPAYAEGMIFCPLSGGRVQAFNASTLESLWVYTDALGGQSLSPITYSNGYIYTGFWNGETKNANYVCLSITDEDVTSTNEAKTASWKHAQAGGFYWAGSVVVGDAVIVGTDDGTSSANGSSKLYSFNKLTGAVISELDITGDQRSSIAYDKSSGKIYFTTKCGYLYSASVNSETGVLSGLKGVDHKAQSTSTPIVYKGKVYFGTGSGISASGSTGNMAVADANSLELLYYKELLGYPQCSFLMTNAYEASTGYIYFYSTYNMTPGGITMIKVDPSKNTADCAEIIELYDAAGFSQYCITSLICGADGTIFYKNDSANVLAVGVPQAEGVTKLIDAIGTVTRDSENVITIARNAFDALLGEERENVTNYTVLTAAESALNDIKAADSVMALISDIGTVTSESQEVIIAARTAYDALTNLQKAKVENFAELTDAEAAYKLIAEKIGNVKTLIDAIGTVKYDDEIKTKIYAARATYDKLSDDEKAQVTNYMTLTAAEKLYEQLKNAQKVIDLINAIGDVTDDSGDAIQAARAAYKKLTGEEKALVTNYSILTAAERKIESLDPSGSTKVIGDGDTKAVIDGVTYMVSAETATLMKVISRLSKAENPDKQAIIDAFKAYAAMTDKQKAEVFNYDDLEALTNVLGLENHKDAGLGIEAEGIDWYIELVVEEKEEGDVYDILSGSIGRNTLIKLWNISFKNLLTGEEFHPTTTVKIKIAGMDLSGHDQIRIAHYTDNGRIEYYDCKIENGYVIWESNDFSYYGIIGGSGEAIKELDDETDTILTIPIATTGAEADNPLLWLWIVLGCVGVAALAVVLALMLKRKKGANDDVI